MRMSDHVRRDAAQQASSDGTAGVTADDDEIGAFGLGGVNQGRCGIAFPDEVLSRDAELSRIRDAPGKC